MFLAQKGIDEDHRGQIVDELFSKCDKNGDGDVQIQEFVDYYIITKNELILRKEELSKKILADNQVLTKLKKEEAAIRLNASRSTQAGTIFNLKLGSAENLGFETKAAVVAVSHAVENKVSSRQMGPTARWNGE